MPLRVHYELALASGETAREHGVGDRPRTDGRDSRRRRDRRVEARTIGVVAAVEEVGTRRARAAIDYPWRELVSDLPQLVNLLYGNISLQRGIRIAGVDWPAELLRQFPGPAFGVAGLRELTGVVGRPLLAGALKPVGLGVRELARLAADCALGGLDLIKDDHSLADQRERAVPRTGADRGRARRAGQPADRQELPLRAESHRPGRSARGASGRPARRRRARRDGRAAAPRSRRGAGALRGRRGAGVALVGHPAFSGSLVAPRQGLAPGLLFGELFRIAGCDVVIYPNAGGRFPFTLGDCRAIQRRLLAPLGGLRPAFAMVAGGIDAAKLARWLPEYAIDTIFLRRRESARPAGPASPRRRS